MGLKPKRISFLLIRWLKPAVNYFLRLPFLVSVYSWLKPALASDVSWGIAFNAHRAGLNL